MKRFLIKYRFAGGSAEEWHQEIARFIAALENDAALGGRISYRCMKNKDGSDYYHLATVVDDEAVKELGDRDFFSHYTERSDFFSGGTVEVLPLETIAETSFKA